MRRKSVQGIILLPVILIVVLFFVGIGYFLYSQGYIDKLFKKSESETGKGVVIGLSLGTLREERWATDRDLFIERAEQLGAEVTVQSANSDADLQNTQIENFISQGVKIIVIVPQDGEKVASVVQKAHEAGVKTIAYDRLIKDSDLDLYISFDNIKVGEMEAEGVVKAVGKGNFAYIGGSPSDNNAFLVKEGSMKVLNPKIKKGDITLVLDEFTQNWSADIAYKTMKNYLAGGGSVDAVVAANDGTAFGVIQALKEKGLDGKVPVSGQDAELSACQRIIEGTQTVTVYKPIKSLAYKAAELAIDLATGKKIKTTTVTNNGKIDVPSYLLAPTSVNKENMMDTVIKDGFHTYDEVYTTASK
jgi:D-xylose transport system substrate-binding protein